MTILLLLIRVCMIRGAKWLQIPVELHISVAILKMMSNQSEPLKHHM